MENRTLKATYQNIAISSMDGNVIVVVVVVVFSDNGSGW
jgi:hypothetical protein